ncbi:MAG: universal stress protein, partial [bacterium]
MSDETAEVAAPQRIFLVVVDDSQEMPVALRYAALRARHTGGRVALLYVI